MTKHVSYVDWMNKVRGAEAGATVKRKSSKRRVCLKRDGKGKFIRKPIRKVCMKRNAKGHFVKKVSAQRATRSYKKKNPISVRKSYPKRTQLRRDLTRYERACIVGKSVKRFKSKSRRKAYCAGVAWKRARASKRYRNYPGFKKSAQESTAMARKKSRKKSHVARRRHRTSKGRFTKSAAAAPRRRRRRRHVAAAAPRHRRRRHVAAAAPRRRRRRHHVAAAPRRRRRRRSYAGEAAMAPRRRRRRRAVYTRRRHGGGMRKIGRRPVYGRRRKGGGYRKLHEYALENPLSGGEFGVVLLTGGLGFALAEFAGRWLATTALTAGQTDDAPQVSAVAGSTAPNYANDVATVGQQGWKSMAAKGGVLLAGFALTIPKQPWVRATGQGIAIGAGINLVGDLFKMGMAKLLHDKDLGRRLFLAEIKANDIIAANNIATPTFQPMNGQNPLAKIGAATTSTLSGGPRRGFRDPGPVAGVGQNLMTPGPTGVPQVNYGPQSPPMPGTYQPPAGTTPPTTQGGMGPFPTYNPPAGAPGYPQQQPCGGCGPCGDQIGPTPGTDQIGNFIQSVKNAQNNATIPSQIASTTQCYGGNLGFNPALMFPEDK